MRSLALVFIVLLSGCAVGNKYSYEQARVNLPVQGDARLAVDVDDQRPYVLSGDKSPDFVGLQRGGFGNPFNVTTSSGRPLESDMQAVLIKALEQRGFRVAAADLGGGKAGTVMMVVPGSADRALLLKVREWKTDIYASVTLHYDLELQIFDETGNVVATSTQSGIEPIGGAGMPSSNSQAAVDAFEQKLAYLFNVAEVRSALE